MKKQILLILSVLLSTMVSMADVSVFGRITDTEDEPLLGVSILVKGTNNGTITDAAGEFQINVPGPKTVLICSYLGYQTQEVTIGKQTELMIRLKEVVQDLDEVVVVGYGVQKKSHLTGSVSKFDDEQVSNMAYSRLDQALQGKIAGVQIVNTSSEAGASPMIRVRGMGSLSANNAPLVVIDGYPTEDGLSYVDMNDVESIEVLKDAASAAIYGSRGANGVIMITTKSGSVTKPKYTIKAYTGFKQAYQLHDIMSSTDYVNMLNHEMELGGAGPNNNEKAWLAIGDNTDWQKQALRDVANITNAQLSVSGGKKDLKYYVSGNFTRDEGIMVHSLYTKFNLRAKMDAQLGERVKLSINLAPSYAERESPATNFIDYYRTPSWLPVKHTEATSAITGKPVGSWAHGRHFNNIDYTLPDGSLIENASPWNTANNNPASIMENENRHQRDLRMTGNIALTIDLCKGLTFRTSDGFYVQYRDNRTYHNLDAKADGDPNYALYTNRLAMNVLSENTFNYTASWGQHNFGAMAGFTCDYNNYYYAGIKGTGFPTDLVPTINAATDITISDADGTRRTYTRAEDDLMLSVLARVNYDYDGRYLASVAVRTDGSSKFGIQKQWGWFPSVSLGWRMSEESWLKNQDWLNQLKIRGSWGITGNNDIENYAAYDKLSSANYTFGTSGVVSSGLANTSTTMGNKAISWEQTNEFDLGLDFSAVKSRVNLTVDGYYSTTKALLLQQAAMGVTGYSNYWNNIGRVRNMGVEVELNTYNIKNKNFTWQTTLNLSHNDNRLLELGGEERMLNYGERQEIYAAIVGGPSIQYYGYKTDGVWLSQEEIDQFCAGRDTKEVFLVGKEPKPGTLKVVDVDNSGTIDAYDRTPLGSPFPTLNWGMTNTFLFYGVDISLVLQGVAGVKILEGDGYYNETKKYNRAYTTNRYISESNPGNGRTPTYSAYGIGWELTDYVIQDASYGAIKDLIIGYTFNKKQLRKIKMQSIHLYVSGQNLLYIWNKNYKGINPESRYTSSVYSSPLISGYQRGGFPIQRSFSFGVEFNF